eukprot:scaffold437_cov122-Isochrysis_galbana.AAC.11
MVHCQHCATLCARQGSLSCCGCVERFEPSRRHYPDGPASSQARESRIDLFRRLGAEARAPS